MLGIINPPFLRLASSLSAFHGLITSDVVLHTFPRLASVGPRAASEAIRRPGGHRETPTAAGRRCVRASRFFFYKYYSPTPWSSLAGFPCQE